MGSGVPMQSPPEQASLLVHPLPSLQEVPSGALVVTHVSACSSQVPVLQSVLHFRGKPLVHAPLIQTSIAVQYCPSLQGQPFFLLPASQAPLLSLQMPTTHWPLLRWEQSL